MNQMQRESLMFDSSSADAEPSWVVRLKLFIIQCTDVLPTINKYLTSLFASSGHNTVSHLPLCINTARYLEQGRCWGARVGRLERWAHKCIVGGLDTWQQGGEVGGAGDRSLLEWKGARCQTSQRPGGEQELGRLTLLLQTVQHRLSVHADHLQLPHLLLSDLVIAVRDQVLPHLGQGEGYPRVSLGWRSKGCYFHVKFFLKMLILWILWGSELFFLRTMINQDSYPIV